jgi:hypothetical protein
LAGGLLFEEKIRQSAALIWLGLQDVGIPEILYSRKLKNQKPIVVDVLFKAYPMVPHSSRSNLAGRYH